MPDTLHPLAALAERLHCSERTARRRLLDAMQADPGLRVVRRGRTILLSEPQIQRVIRALEWRSTSASAAMSGTRAAPSGRAARLSPSPSSAQDAARALMQKLRQKPRPGASATRHLTALPGGRAP